MDRRALCASEAGFAQRWTPALMDYFIWSFLLWHLSINMLFLIEHLELAGTPHLCVAGTLVALSAGALLHCCWWMPTQHPKKETGENGEGDVEERTSENEQKGMEEEDEDWQDCANVSVISECLAAINAHDILVQALKQELTEVADRERAQDQFQTEYEHVVNQLESSSAKCSELRTELHTEQIAHKTSMQVQREHLQQDHLQELQALNDEIRRLREAPFSATFPWQIQVDLPWEPFPGAPSHVHRAQVYGMSESVEPLTRASQAFHSFVARKFEMDGNPFRIRSITALHSVEWQRTFEGRLRSLEERRQTGGVFRGAGFSDDPHKVFVIERLLRSFLPRPPGTSLANTIYVWHGAPAEAIDGIAKTGFANLGTTDDGFFGRGLYATLEAAYACKYATGELLDVAQPSPWRVIFAVACMDAAYPVTRRDYFPGENSCRFMGGEMVRGYYAHVAVVDSAMNWQAAVDPSSPDLNPMEVVLKTEEQILPLAIVEFEEQDS